MPEPDNKEDEEPVFNCDNEGNVINTKEEYLVIYKVKKDEETKTLIFENVNCLAEFLLPQGTPLIFKATKLLELKKMLEEALG